MEGKLDIGLIGLGVMGENLALNMAGKGFGVAVYNRTVSKTEEFMAGQARKMAVAGAFSLTELVGMLKKPRKVLLMVKAGMAVDAVIEELLPLLEAGDIILDGGNSYFSDTQRRSKAIQQQGIRYLGVGISGGEEGALHGPSIMPGGDRDGYAEVEPILTAIAARAGGKPCCSYIGADGAGHYVKMVHNGIEYGDMQLIGEAYLVLKDVLGLDADQIQAVFRQWNEGELESYLIEITANIMGYKDKETGKPLVELILDKTGQKGTGRWVSQNALELGVPVSTITEAVFARCMSSYKEERLVASRLLAGPTATFQADKEQFIAALGNALYAAKVCSYAQGFALLQAAGRAYYWDLQLGGIALLWRGGCIIRARFLDHIHAAYTADGQLANLLLDPCFSAKVQAVQGDWRKVAVTCMELGVPIPGFASALAYFDSYRRAVLPANLLQAQRDYFGAHTYERVDRPGQFHTDWLAGK